VSIAIVGLACLFPGAADLDRFWRNIVDGVDAIGDVPPQRWDPAFYDPASTAVDRFYCRRGGFVDDDAQFDPLRFGIPPKTVAAIEPDQLLTLKIGYRALEDAGYGERPFARARTGVIVGRGNYVTAGVLRLEQHVRLLPQILQTLRDLFPDLPEPALAAARERLRQSLSYYGPDAAAGLIPNLIASRLANRLDLHGPAYTVDAACASSLIAVEQACASLQRGDTDMMLVGGAHLTHDLTFWATFCQLGALSRSGVARPLAADADGILAGEGVGMAVLKRLDDALRDGDRIYAVIAGAGSASDGRGGSLIAPATEGQQKALENAWKTAPFAREAIGLLEAHGTGTPAGDAVELETVGEFFGAFDGKGQRPVIGSVKSMIGHAMPASGMASLIKTALSIHHGVLPPTLHCERPHPHLAATRFRTIARAEPWRQACAQRIGALNAFGFGGINAHLVLRGPPQRPTRTVAGHAPSPAPLPPVLCLSADTPQALLARFDRGECDDRASPRAACCRLVVVAPDARKLETARRAIVSGKPWQGRQQIWFSPQGLISGGGKLAFVFPGVDSIFEPQAADLAAHFGRALPRYCEALDTAQSVSKVVIGLLGFNRFLFDILSTLNIRADGFAGHSVGEWSAMLCAGLMDQALSDRTNAALDVNAQEFPDLQFLAANCGEQKLREAMQGLQPLALSHDNCPHQAIACGSREAIDVLAQRLHGLGVVAHRLPFVSGFHSPLFGVHVQWYRDFFGSAKLVEPTVPVWSATTAQPFPRTMAAKRRLAVDHLLQPVRFRTLTEAMYDDGFRVFVQVGTGSLAGFIDDTLSGRPHQAIQANHPRRSGLAQLQQLCAALWVEGAEFDTALLAGSATGAQPMPPEAAGERPLALGVPLLRVHEPLEPSLRPAHSSSMPELSGAAANDPVARMVWSTLADIERAGREVLTLWERHRGSAPHAERSAIHKATQHIDLRVQRLLDLRSTVPYLRDHALYPQRDGWPIVGDGYPVVPLAMEIMLVREAVEEALPGLKVIEISHAAAYNWLAVSEPLTVDITLRSVADGVIETEIVGYFKAQVTVAAQYPQAPMAAMPELINGRPTEIDATALYAERWMFHGPAYQGVEAFRGIGDNGIDGMLRVPSGKGALLDNMGQLAGYWVMEQPDNCLAMPIGIDRIRFFVPDLRPGEKAECQVRIDAVDAHTCVSSHRLRDATGRPCVAIDGWRTRRYAMDKAFWIASRQLSQYEVSQFVPPNVAVFEDRYDTAVMRDYIGRRYLSASERAVYDALPPGRRRQWLNGRVAAKDAVRAWLRRKRGVESVFPQEFCIVDDDDGAPKLQSNVTATVPPSLQVSISHCDHLAFAIVGERPVGIAIERVDESAAGSSATPLATAELALLAGEDSAEARLRALLAKKVFAKISGRTAHESIVEQRDGACFRIGGEWIVTHKLHNHVVAWSLGVHGDPQAETVRICNG
jgi:acyl transferase domain-containing protein/phosphopantetheinyl transferase (holo-ACP synthase)